LKIFYKSDIEKFIGLISTIRHFYELAILSELYTPDSSMLEYPLTEDSINLWYKVNFKTFSIFIKKNFTQSILNNYFNLEYQYILNKIIKEN